MRLKSLLVGLLALVAVFGPVELAHAEKSYYLSEWSAIYDVHESSDVYVTEQITFDFTGSFSWAERFIPARRLDTISHVRVLNEQGEEPRNLEIDQRGTTTYVRWDHESQDEERTWIISYVVEGGLSYLGDRDELYWNITGEEWPVSIRNASATVILPESAGLVEDDLQYRVRYNDGYVTNPKVEVVSGSVLRFSADRLNAENGLTLVANWPEGVTERPKREHVQTFWFTMIGTVFWVLIGIAVVVMIWSKYGKEHRKLNAIVAQYEPPKDVPVDVIYALLGGKSKKDGSIPGVFVELANKGYIRIEQLGESDSSVMQALKKLSKSPKYAIHKTQPGTDGTPINTEPLSQIQKGFLEAMFADGEPLNMPTRKQRRALMSYVQRYNTHAGKWLKTHGYIEARAERLRLIMVVVGLAGLIGGLLMAVLLSMHVHVSFIVIGVGTMVFGAVTFLFSLIMRRWTEEGLQAKEYVLGLRDYLHTAERFRLEDVEPGQFTTLLPWAVALGVQKQWEKRFKDIEVPTPSWYRGAYFDPTVVSIAGAAGSVGSFASDFSSFMSSAGSFTSGLTGGSGSGGGSGGGGGGGGGGGAG